MTDLLPGPLGVCVLLLAAALVGFSKTGVPGAGPVAVAMFAAVLPAKASTGALLPLLMVGDLFALAAYRRHGDRAALLRLFPSVAVGVLLGVVFVDLVDDTVMRRTIAVVLLVLVAVHLVSRRFAPDDGDGDVGRARSLFFGSTAGFTTMVANAGGAVMSLYLLAARMDKLRFLGTAAWFFFLVNAFKVPFSVGLGLLTWDSLGLNLLLVPGVLVGAWVGRRVVRRIPQSAFERLVLVLTVVAAINLLR